jgi:hypothetical protein
MRFVTTAALFLQLMLTSSITYAGGLAIFRIDPLGVDPQIVSRLEGLLRIELSRLADSAMPSPRQITDMLRKYSDLQNCTGEVGCLVRIGRLLNVDRIISGNVGGLADNFVVNLKIVDVSKRKELRRIQEPISGQPDQLIEAVRVAAYGLVAPERLRGALVVLADQPDAEVYLNGKLMGRTPLKPLHALPVGNYILRVTKEGYTEVLQDVRVRFQKSAQVLVKLQPPKVATKGKTIKKRLRRPYPWYTRWWFWTAVGVVAAGIGAGLGVAIGGQDTGVDCSTEPERCGL